MPAFLRSICQRSIWQIVRRRSFKPNPNAVVIVAAVRTPNSVPWAKEEHQLAGIVIDELVKRTSVPRDEFKKLIMCTSSNVGGKDSLSNVVKSLGLKGCQTHAIQDETCSVSGLRMSLESLQKGEGDWIILGDTRTNINQVEQNSVLSELMTTGSPKRARALSEINESSSSSESPSAAALALTTAQEAERLQLQPLAVVREFFIAKDDMQAIYRLNDSQPIELSDVHTWEVVMPKTEDQLSMLENLKVADVHTHDFKQITASHLLTHTVHALPAGSLGCVIMEATEGQCLLMVLEKLVPQPATDQNLPQLTLYTKEPCPLCDELVAQLENNFAGEFELKKVFIDRKENVRFLRLFRYDIPVLFLNGQFLCMHSLNEQVLRERLAALENKDAHENKTSNT